MGFLTDIPSQIIRTNRSRITVMPSFDNVLGVQKLFREEELNEYEKINTALRILVKNDWNLKLFSMPEKELLLDEIYEKCIKIKKRPSSRKSPVPVLDFEEDGEYIYASFMQDYRLDLIDLQGHLHWKKFIALFDGLSEDTKIRQVMRIREMEIPVFNGKNQKQIQDIMDLKSYYALPVRGMGGESGLDLLFSTLEGMARH